MVATATSIPVWCRVMTINYVACEKLSHVLYAKQSMDILYNVISILVFKDPTPQLCTLQMKYNPPCSNWLQSAKLIIFLFDFEKSICYRCWSSF